MVELCKLPSGVSGITVNYDIHLRETGTFSSTEKTFGQPGDGKYMRWPAWTKRKLLSKAIDNITHFSFTMEMTVVSVLDSNKNDIIKQYMVGGTGEQKDQAVPVANDDKVNVLESRMNSLTVQVNNMMETLQQLQLQMNEEQKAEGNSLQQQIDELTVSVHKMQSNDSSS